MSTITVPDQHLIVDKEWQHDVPAQANKSGWTGHAQIVGLPGAETWLCTARVRTRTTEVAKRPWRAFLVALRGIQNNFQLQAACQQRSGSNPVVGSSPSNGYTLPLGSLPVSQTVLVAGQFMTVPLPSGHKRLVCLTADLVSNGSGVGTATFEPALGETPDVGATVETINPYALMRLRERANGWSETGGVASMAIVAEEDL